jgi:hypothetical protein
METYSAERSTAVHEAGHAVMAYLLRRAFVEISVVEDGDSLGHVTSAPMGEWFRPDIEMDARTRRLIEDRVMILLAGAETEAAWCARLADAPDDAQEQIELGARRDLHNAISLASAATGNVRPVPPRPMRSQSRLRLEGRARTLSGPSRI